MPQNTYAHTTQQYASSIQHLTDEYTPWCVAMGFRVTINPTKHKFSLTNTAPLYTEGMKSCYGKGCSLAGSCGSGGRRLLLLASLLACGARIGAGSGCRTPLQPALLPLALPLSPHLGLPLLPCYACLLHKHVTPFQMIKDYKAMTNGWTITSRVSSGSSQSHCLSSVMTFKL